MENYKEYSNSELQAEMFSANNEYEDIKRQIGKLIDRMKELDKKYNKLQSELSKRRAI